MSPNLRRLVVPLVVLGAVAVVWAIFMNETPAPRVAKPDAGFEVAKEDTGPPPVKEEKPVDTGKVPPEFEGDWRGQSMFKPWVGSLSISESGVLVRSADSATGPTVCEEFIPWVDFKTSEWKGKPRGEGILFQEDGPNGPGSRSKKLSFGLVPPKQVRKRLSLKERVAAQKLGSKAAVSPDAGSSEPLPSDLRVSYAASDIESPSSEYVCLRRVLITLKRGEPLAAMSKQAGKRKKAKKKKRRRRKKRRRP